jgi:hypothetical protein
MIGRKNNIRILCGYIGRADVDKIRYAGKPGSFMGRGGAGIGDIDNQGYFAIFEKLYKSGKIERSLMQINIFMHTHLQINIRSAEARTQYPVRSRSPTMMDVSLVPPKSMSILDSPSE